MLQTSGFVHFTIPVKDLDRSEAFYTQVMGLRKLRRNRHMVFMEGHGVCFVLTHSENPIDPNPGDQHDIHGIGLLCTSTHDGEVDADLFTRYRQQSHRFGLDIHFQLVFTRLGRQSQGLFYHRAGGQSERCMA